MQTQLRRYFPRERQRLNRLNPLNPASVSGMSYFCKLVALKKRFLVCNTFCMCFARNRRSAQGDRLSAITMALQAGSESDEDSILTGTYPYFLFEVHFLRLPYCNLSETTCQLYLCKNTLARSATEYILKDCSLKYLCLFLYSVSGTVRIDTGETEADCGLSAGDPILQLYQSVRGARSVQGQLLAEPFLQLPVRREYPDYYHQIKNPISLQQIRCG